jgi:hypothetical protein
VDSAGEISRSGKIRAVIAATADAATATPTSNEGGSERTRHDDRTGTSRE